MKKEEIYNQLSADYNHLYLQAIHDFQNKYASQNKSNKYYVNFYPSFGIRRNEPCDFLFYGQAVNGWESGFHTQKKATQANIQNSISASNSFLEVENQCPLDWVNVMWSSSTYRQYTKNKPAKEFYKGLPYRAFRSFFWNVTYKVISDYYPGFDRDGLQWSKKLIWSNLYKIAPKRGNPGNYDQLYQRPMAIELVKKELEELTPKYCIVLTNDEWWAPFRSGIKTEKLSKTTGSSCIQSVEKFQDTLIIVTSRPRVGNSERRVKAILAAIKKHKS